MVQTPNYRSLSFRGVQMRAESVTVEVPARGGPLHLYVDESLPYFEDTGKTPRKVIASAFFRGVDHLDFARELERAVAVEGGGQLVLPNRQTFNMVCTVCTRTDSLESEKNQTRFELEFTPAEEFRFPGSVLSDALALIDEVRGAIALVQSILFAPADLLASVSAAMRVTFAQAGQAFQAVNSASDVFARLDVLDNIEAPSVAVNSALSLSDFETQARPVDRATATQDQIFEAEFRVASALKAVELTTGLNFENRRNATLVRDRIEDALLADLDILTPEAQASVLAIRNRHLRDFQQRILTLPTFRVVDTGVSLPSVVAAHRVFGDYTREEDLRSWNEVEHPLFMPSSLDVLG